MDIDDPLDAGGAPKWVGYVAALAAVLVVAVVYLKSGDEAGRVGDVAFTEEEFNTSAPSRNGLKAPVTAPPEKVVAASKSVAAATQNPFEEPAPAVGVTAAIVDTYKKEAPETPRPPIEPKTADAPYNWGGREQAKRSANTSELPEGKSLHYSSPIVRDETSRNTQQEIPMDSSGAAIDNEEQMMRNLLMGRQETKVANDTMASRLSSHRKASHAIPTGSRDGILSRGKTLPCILETAIQTDLPGLTRCLIARPVYSDSGKRLLIPRGTVATGEYQGGIKRGVNRIFIVWTRLRTPDGVITELAAPGVGPLGASGVHAKLNNHWRSRFGASVLLSLIGGLSATEDNSEGSTFGASADALSRTAELALEESIGIKTTGSVPIGSLINIMVAEDINFDLVRHNVR